MLNMLHVNSDWWELSQSSSVWLANHAVLGDQL